MGIKRMLSIFTVLLVVAAFAAAANAAEMSPLTGGGSCAASSLSTLDLPGLAPRSTPLLAGLCGTCSLSPCQGARIGTPCQISFNRSGTCQNVNGNICSGGGGINMCQCWNGPLP